MSWLAFYVATGTLILMMGLLYRNTVVADRKLAADRKRLSAYQIAKMEHESLSADTDWGHGIECPKCRPKPSRLRPDRPKVPLPDPVIDYRRDKLNKRRSQIQVGGDGVKQVQVGAQRIYLNTHPEHQHVYKFSSGKCIICGKRSSF